ncbi:MAG: hypothetical protein Q4C70_05025 [Planctomycetia bacterium]|nr:hypothetical protein [Planctomycetia bacterium]
MAKKDVKKHREKVLYLFGQRYRKSADGKLVPICTKDPGGRCGCESVTMRVPVPLVPVIRHFMEKFEEIEDLRKNIARNCRNTSPEVEAILNIVPLSELLKEEAD